jgi:sulfoxide reductase heme-binding subunit YedZ
MSGTLPWYVARASGLVAWGLLAASVVWGLLMTSKVIRRVARSSWLLDLHRWLAGLAVVFTAIHVVAILGDSYVHFGLASVLVPLATHWHPVAVAYGIASMYLLVAIEITSLLRRHINRRAWRAVHFLSFPLFVSSTVHGLSAGTDSRAPMVVITVVLVALAVAALTAVRVTGSTAGEPVRPSPPRPPTHPATPGRHPTPTSYLAPTPAGDGYRRTADPYRLGADPADTPGGRPTGPGRQQGGAAAAYRLR